MSKLGKALIDAVQDAKKKRLVTLEASSDVAALGKQLKLSQREYINPETLKSGIFKMYRKNP